MSNFQVFGVQPVATTQTKWFKARRIYSSQLFVFAFVTILMTVLEVFYSGLPNTSRLLFFHLLSPDGCGEYL